MRYPSTSQYIESLENPDGLFRTLVDVVALRGFDGIEPHYCSGNFGTVFKIRVGGRDKALKCFTRAQRGRLSAYRQISEYLEPSKHIISYDFLENEMYVFDETNSGSYFPVLTMDWVAGDTLSVHTERAVKNRSSKRINELLELFDELAGWLLTQPFAHGDLKPDNIMISSTGDMVLIDYDGMYLPQMQGEAARELGTQTYQHPARATAPFDKHIDDYSIAYIHLALMDLAHNLDHYHGESIVRPEYIVSNPLLSRSSLRIDELYGHLTHSGTAELPHIATETTPIIYRENGLYGYADSNGTRITDPVFSRANDFSESLASVSQGGKWGYINTRGEIVIPLIYSSGGNFSQGRAAVTLASKYGYIDSRGRAVSKFCFDNAWSFAREQDLALVQKNQKYGFVGLDGKMVISARYDFAQSFCEGLAVVKIGHKYGFIDPRGRWHIRPTYDYAQNFRDGKAYVELGNREFYITK